MTDSRADNRENKKSTTAYDPKQVEQRLYKSWIDGGFFTPKIDWAKDPFVVIMPPPNVTGELHVGHALQATLADIMVRWHRMKGDPTLWLPGADHAGIATQVMVERSLIESGLSREKLGRDGFLDRVWEWVLRYGNAIDEQHKRLGASCDWTRRTFTLDEAPSKAVRTTFSNLYGKGLIYRGERIINWCCRCSTALSDLEVEHLDESSFLYNISYQIDGSEDFITVATTRPETLVADTGLAVNPSDIRYKHLIGKWARLPIVGRLIPVLGDEAVDPSFGTGALKVTPGHDPVDFEVGQRHSLPVVTAMRMDGTMNEQAGPYEDMDRFQCRERILEDLSALGLLCSTEPYSHSVGHCGRCSVSIEPMVSKQWFVTTDDLADRAIDVVRTGEIKIIPERFTRVYLNWMENIRDWCISRQLWWGHRIPAWYCLDCSGESVHLAFPEPFGPKNVQIGSYTLLRDQGFSWNVMESASSYVDIGLDAYPIVSIEKPEECPGCGGDSLLQDPDVLDTWFSSALWPHSTLGWPEHTDDLRYFYPTSVMETGYDILFFWVARMIMMGLENTDKVPFKYVYLSGLIRDQHGAKMSKTRGNVTDPIDAIDTYGTDALRFTLTTGNAPGNDLRISEAKLGASRNFINKLWNASRFVSAVLDDGESHSIDWLDPDLTNIHDRWIVSRLNTLIINVDKYMDNFLFSEAQRELHDFLWNEFCDWYIEIAKLRLRSAEQPSPLPVLLHVLERLLRLMHPFTPFVTEEIWQNLMHKINDDPDRPASIVIAQYPEVDESRVDHVAEQHMEALIDIVKAMRNTKAEFKIPNTQNIFTEILAGNSSQLLSRESDIIDALTRSGTPVFVNEDESTLASSKKVSVILNHAVIFMDLEGLVDTEKERLRLQNELQACETNIYSIAQRLNSNDFLSKAPEDVVERENERIVTIRTRRQRVQELLSQL